MRTYCTSTALYCYKPRYTDKNHEQPSHYEQFFFRQVPLSYSNLSIINPFLHDTVIDQTKLKAFADNKLNVTKMIISVFDRVENIVGKGEIACTSNFSFSHNVFKRLLS